MSTVHGPNHEVQADQQAEADWFHSPEWTADHDRIDAQREDALADNRARDREAGS